jgi:hypothetical protein
MLSPEAWGARLVPKISARRARVLCEEGRVEGAVCHGRNGPRNRRTWEIPDDAPDPRMGPGRPAKDA